MPLVPAFILRRLYVKGSLKNALDGWKFTLRNSLGSGYAIGLVPVVLDGDQEIPMIKTWFESEGTTVTFDQVAEDNTFGLKMNTEIVINVIGDRLEDGEHTVYFGCIIPGIGEIGFDLTDEI
jgi:hypothetical protein